MKPSHSWLRIRLRQHSSLVDPYRLIYSVDERSVVILGLLHQRRDFERWDRSPST